MEDRDIGVDVKMDIGTGAEDGGVEVAGAISCSFGEATGGVAGDTGVGSDEEGVGVGGRGSVGCFVGAAAGGVAGDTGVKGDEAGIGVGGHVRQSVEDCGSDLESGDMAGTGSGIVG
jgi:hypothetical protein